MGTRSSARGVVGTALLAILIAAVLPPSTTRAGTATPPSVLLIITDDQRADSLWVMPTVESELAGHGLRFRNGFVTNPLCCPSRASLLTGQYSHSVQVWFNEVHGGFVEFDDDSTLATWLDDAGYRTGLFGRYLNGYGSTAPTYVPPGWDRWFALVEGDYVPPLQMSDDGTLVEAPPGSYSTTLFADEAEAFIRETPADEPFFAYLAPEAPHAPSIPASQDDGAFDSLADWRPPSYDEDDVSDKPLWLQKEPPWDEAAREAGDEMRKDQLETLLALDREVADLIAALEETGRLENTLVIYTSDNGVMWREHRIWGKNVPYDSTVRVPLVLRYDPLTQGGGTGAIGLNIDLAPTIADLADVPAPGVDGKSLVPLLDGTVTSVRSRFLVEHADGGAAPAFCAARSRSILYVRYATGEEELYDYGTDPWELDNAADATRLGELRRWTKRRCSPVPPGFSW